MSLFVFVEGPDGAGKTTFIEELKHKIGEDFWGMPKYKVKHFGVPEDPTTQVGIYMDAMERDDEEVIIFDRCWYSDMVYGLVMRGGAGITEVDCRLLEEYVQTRGRAMVVYLTAHPNILWERCLERGEDYIKDKKTLQKLSNGYERLFAIHKIPSLPVLRIDTSGSKER